MFGLFLIVGINSYLTFELSLGELTNSLGARNEGQINNIMQDLDKFIEKRLEDFKSLSKVKEIQEALRLSNEEFSTSGVVRESFITTKIFDPQLTSDLRDLIQFYKDEYDYDVIEELLVLNKYGINIIPDPENKNALQDEKDWWNIARQEGTFIDKLQYNKNFQRYSIPIAFRISDDEGNFLGVMKVSISMDDILHDFVSDAEVTSLANKNVILLDQDGRIIYSDGFKFDPQSQAVSYFEKIENDTGFFEMPQEEGGVALVSYSKSIGYGNFGGFGWTSVLVQPKSFVVSEFLELRESILTISILGMIASIVIGIIFSLVLSKPLQEISKMASQISEGNFDVRAKKSRIKEMRMIGEAFNKMAISLKKLVQTEKDLIETRIKMRNERLVAIGQVAASMAHNIKNPLAVIKSSSEIIKRSSKNEDKDQEDAMMRMNNAIDRISHQIEDVLNFTRITPLDIKSVNINSIFESSLKSLEIPKNISIELPKNDSIIKCDVRKLEIVFINLILNAIQAIGQNTGKITIKSSQVDGELMIEVQDSGPGIPDEIMSKIFEPLTTSKQKGTGLGLPTCKNIIEQHGGTIRVKNNPTTFTVRLPTNVN